MYGMCDSSDIFRGAEGFQALVRSGAMGRKIERQDERSQPEAEPYLRRDWQRQYVFVAATLPDDGEKSVGAEIGQVSQARRAVAAWLREYVCVGCWNPWGRPCHSRRSVWLLVMVQLTQ